MAQIVFGACLSHTPQLHTPAAEWDVRVRADHANKAHVFRGKRYDWAGLVAARAHENLGPEAALDKREAKLAASHKAIDELTKRYNAAAPDVAVVVGNDQHELFLDEFMPAFTVFWGERIRNQPRSKAQQARLPAGIAVADHGHVPPQTEYYPGAPDLGRFIIDRAIAEGFDVAHARELPQVDEDHSILSGIPHAYGFVYRQIMKDTVIPNVPIILNTFYPPNQPKVARCYAFGQMIGRAVRAWNTDVRVAIFGSGGLSHFVVDADFDRTFLEALARNDVMALEAAGEAQYQSGNSECKNWITAAGILSVAGLKMTVVDYQPLYRSEGGTGTGSAYAYWS